MKIFYVANSRIPTEKAHGIQIMKTCEALVAAGADIKLIVPTRRNTIFADPFAFYAIKHIFPFVRLHCPDLVDFGRVGVSIQTLFFSFYSFFYILFNSSNEDTIFCRDPLPLFFISLIRSNCVWEVHDGRNNLVVSRLLKTTKAIVAITQGLKDYYVKQGTNPEKIRVIADGVDPEAFRVFDSKATLRNKLDVPANSKVVMYTGHLYEWKGTDTLGQAAELLPHVTFMFIGGTKRHIEEFKTRFGHNPNIQMMGQKSHSEIPSYLKVADVVVLPNSGKFEISRLFTSPVKLFEYMASGVPIVASDLPSIREVLDEKTAVLVEPDSPDALAAGISKILDNPGLGEALSAEALARVDTYSWAARATSILEIMK